MSIPREYFETLEPTARQRYIKKLELLQLTENDDPYAAKNEHYFVDDMTLWPSVEYGHIFCYFVGRPGVYSKRELMQWRSLDAYEYFQAGHVRTVGEGCSHVAAILFKIESAVRNGYIASIYLQ